MATAIVLLAQPAAASKEGKNAPENAEEDKTEELLQGDFSWNSFTVLRHLWAENKQWWEEDFTNAVVADLQDDKSHFPKSLQGTYFRLKYHSNIRNTTMKL